MNHTNGSVCHSRWFSRMVDVIGWCRALSGVVTVYKYHTRGTPPLFSLPYSMKQPFHLDIFTDTVSIWHPPPCALLYLLTFFPATFCLSLRGTHRHGSICLNFSFPVWGVYPIPCSRAQQTSNTRTAQNEKWRQTGGCTEKRTTEGMNDGKRRHEWDESVCGDSRAERGRTVEGKILTGDRVKTRGKEVGNTKWLIIMMSTDRAK